ncbi:MAG: 50S ribosomal protein L6 [Patescibacteria group bacterium]
MSRIGKKPIAIPAGVEVAITPELVTVKGLKGTLTRRFHPHVRIAIAEAPERTATVTVKNPDVRTDRALWGLSARLLSNMIAGVTAGFEKRLEIVGIGYKASVSGSTLTLEVGFSHPVVFPLPSGIAAKVEKNTIAISGSDKELVGETAARIRAIRKPEPYKGKGIKYADEVIRRKAGKAAKAGAAAK